MSVESTGRARRMRLLAVLTLLFVFVAGGMVGAAVERGRHDGGRHRPQREGRLPPMFSEASPLVERLGLTAVQRDSIEKITARDRARADSIFREMRHEMRSRFDSSITAVNSVLTPGQRAEWQKIRQEMQAQERERRMYRIRRSGGREGGPRIPGEAPPPGRAPGDSGPPAPGG